MNIQKTQMNKSAPRTAVDWMATMGDFDLDCTVGHGCTESEAIQDLLEQEGFEPSDPEWHQMLPEYAADTNGDR